MARCDRSLPTVLVLHILVADVFLFTRRRNEREYCLSGMFTTFELRIFSIKLNARQSSFSHFYSSSRPSSSETIFCVVQDACLNQGRTDFCASISFRLKRLASFVATSFTMEEKNSLASLAKEEKKVEKFTSTVRCDRMIRFSSCRREGHVCVLFTASSPQFPRLSDLVNIRC